MKTLLALVATVGLGKGNLSATQPNSGNVVSASFGRPFGNGTPGAFSLSLTVKDLVTSRTFYDHLGFTVFWWKPATELPHHEKQTSTDRTFSRNVF